MIEEKEKRAGIKILIAEDEMIVAEDLAQTLRDLGYDVVGMASKGEDAIRMAKESKPALVLMDIKLAGKMDGIEASELIRVRFDIPVVFLTAYNEQDVLCRAKQAQPYGYLSKPFSTHILKITIETALYKHASDRRLRESEESYRLVADNANVGIFTTSLDGFFLQANPAVAKMAGYDSVEEFLAIRAEGLYADERDRNRFVNKLLETGSVSHYEVLAQKKDGSPQWVSLNAVIQKDCSGEPASILGIVEDITDRKEAEKALRESEDRYRSLFDNMLEGFAFCKMFFDNGKPQDFVYLDVNEAFKRLTGLEDVIGKRVTEVIPGFKESNPELLEIYGRVALSGNPERFQTYIDSMGIWFSVSVYSTGKELFTAMFENVTNRKKAEEALRKSEKNYRELVQNANSAIIRWKCDGTLTFFNEHAQAIFGYKDEILGKDVRILVPERESTGASLSTLVEDIVKNPQRYVNNVNENVCRDGQRVWMAWTNKPILDEDGQVSEMLAVGADITALKKSEEALRISEERLRLAQRTANVGIWDWDLKEQTVFWTPEMENLYGINPESVSLYDDWRRIVHPEDLSRIEVERDEAVAQHRAFELEFRIQHPSGETRWLEARGGAIYDETGAPKRVFGVNVDITQKKEMERALAESEERFRTVAEFTYDWEYWINTEDKLLYVSPSCERITGYIPQEFLDDLRLIERIHPDDRTAVSSHFHTARRVEYEESYSVDFRIIRRDGQVRWVNHVCRPVYDRDGRPLGRRASNRDITERKRAESALKRLVTAVEQAAEAIVVTDTTGNIQYVNPAFEKITEYAREEVIGQNPRILRSGEHDAIFYKDLWDTILGGEVWSGRIVNKKKDGTLYHEELTISPVRDSNGKIVNFVAVKRDITDHLQLYRQLVRAQKMEAVGTLAGGVAHDFNNLLQVILGYSELLISDKNKQDPEFTDLQKIHHAAKSGADLVQRLLTFSRKVESKPIPLDLNRQIIQVEKLLRRTIPRMIEIQLDLSEDVSEINADPTQIEQILMNLAVNARDAMPHKGRLTISTQNTTLDEEYCKIHFGAEPGEYVMLSVSDTGHGMTKETMERIFEPFYTTKELGRGTGLGLAMVYGIVKQHQGHITCYSEIGRGTVFHIYFPSIGIPKEPSVEDSGIMPAFGTETILLVDDEEFVKDLGATVLSRSGYTVLTANNGKEALDLYVKERSRISLVILDLIMPEMGGKDCLKELLAIDRELRIFMASGLSDAGSIQECLAIGARGFINKPFKIKELLLQVRKILDQT